MIQITCTSCKRVLSIDDAFAGGVCRCQHCGTIQTVPARGSAQKAASGAVKGSKTLFENKARSAGVGSGSGLEDLADVLQSSGLSNSDLRKSPRTPTPPPAKNLTPVLGIAVAVILILLVVVLVLVFRSSSTPAANSAPPSQSIVGNNAPPSVQNPSPAAPVAASFCGVPIDQSVVVYVIDNGSSSADVLDEIKSALFKSIDSLGSDRQFQVVFWNPDSPAYPNDHATFAVKDNIDAAKNKLQDVGAEGSTDAVAALRVAFASVGSSGGQIFLVTAKAGDLDDSLTVAASQLRGSSKAKIDCIAINGNAGDKVLANVASESGGVFLPLQEGQLKGFAF
jgi:hypothetical protein